MDQNCAKRIISEDYADFILQNDQIPEGLTFIPEFCYDIMNNTHAVAYLPISKLPDNLIQKYSYSIFPKCYGLMDIQSLEDTGITRIQNVPNLGLTGQGVLIGIIDTGIDYSHQAFKNSDGTTKIISIWDQTINTTTSIPMGFYYGTEYLQDQINIALTSSDPLAIVPSIDKNGHGTFLAGIVAGTRNNAKKFSSVAPDARIVVVKLKPAKQYIKNFFSIPPEVDCYQENDIMLGIRYLVGIAEKLSRPISICIGLGTSQGSHESRDALSTYLTTTADQKGVGISIAAGNEGNSGHHYSALVDDKIGYETVELKVGPNNKGFSMELWGNSPNIFSIDILSPTGQYVPRIPARLKETREIKFIFENTKLLVDYELVEAQTGDELILIRFQNPTEGVWRFRIYSSFNLEPRFHIWLPITNFIEKGTYFLKPDPFCTLTSPGNSPIPIVATAYNHVDKSLFVNASKGFTRSNIINPDFAAPGVEMIGPELKNDYTVKSGTSISAAVTAGVVAMFLEWGIVKGNQTQFDTLQIKHILIRGAKRDPSIAYPNKEWGYGMLDVYNAFYSLRG